MYVNVQATTSHMRFDHVQSKNVLNGAKICSSSSTFKMGDLKVLNAAQPPGKDSTVYTEVGRRPTSWVEETN